MADAVGQPARLGRFDRTPAEDQSAGMGRQFDAWVNSHDPNAPVLSG
jgi:hypothetical protein